MTPIICPVCKSSENKVYLTPARDYITGKIFELRYCEQCGLGFTVPKPENLNPYYPARYRRYTPLALAVLRMLYKLRVRSWTRMMGRPGQALEVGCGDGFMLDELRKYGWQVVGTERIASSVSYARLVLDLPVFAGQLEALRPEPHFDLIILFQVLEHMPDPLATLQHCVRLLKPGGSLVIGVPNLDSWQGRFSGVHWLHLDIPRHLSHFSPSSISYALQLTGLDVVKTSFVSMEHDPYGWVQSVLNRMGFKQNRLTRLLMGLDRPSPGNLGMSLIAIVLLIPALLLATVSWMAQAGALMEIRAIKQR